MSNAKYNKKVKLGQCGPHELRNGEFVYVGGKISDNWPVLTVGKEYVVEIDEKNHQIQVLKEEDEV